MANNEFRELVFSLNDMRNGYFTDGSEYNHNASIFKKAAPCILNFPVIVSDLISIEDLTMVNKAIEREYATVVRLAMGLDDIIDGDSITSKINYIKKFHTNNFTSTGRSNRELLNNLNLENLNIYDESYIEEYNENSFIAEDLGLNLNNLNSMTLNEAKKSNPMTINVSLDNPPSNGGDGGGNKPTQLNSGYSKQLLDNDVKKANELIPTTLDITVYQKVGDRTFENHILLGIKCTAHKVSSEAMIENLVTTIKEKRAFFKFIQWTTGEIKFFKDYLFCIDRLKKEALESRNRKGESIKWFRSLKNRATISKLKSSFKLKDTLIPNSTLILTMDEVDYIRNTENIDLLKSKDTVNKLMNTFFLIGFVIIDSSAELAYFKFDGFDEYQVHSFRSLERENRNQLNDIKALTTLMNKF